MVENEINKVKSEDYKVDPYTIDTNDKVLKIEGGRRIETKANMGVFLKLFGDSIYNSDGSAYREQLTNALSHGCMPAIAAGHDAHVEVEIDFNKRRIMVTDVNGMGIPWNLMNEVCTNIGESGNHDRSRSGQHGCGMFSFLKMTSNFSWTFVTLLVLILLRIFLQSHFQNGRFLDLIYVPLSKFCSLF